MLQLLMILFILYKKENIFYVFEQYIVRAVSNSTTIYS